jgi:hypothetical protein
MNLGARKRRWRLDSAPLQGHFLVYEPVLDLLDRILPSFRGPEGLHEGIAFLCGLELGDATVFTTAVVPEADHGAGHVRCDEMQMLAVSSTARSLDLGVLAQVHSHPGALTEHSPGDDRMIYMPFEGMLSIVCPNYGQFGIRPLDSLGVHQFQYGRWILAERRSVAERVKIIPSGVDLR